MPILLHHSAFSYNVPYYSKAQKAVQQFHYSPAKEQILELGSIINGGDTCQVRRFLLQVKKNGLLEQMVKMSDHGNAMLMQQSFKTNNEEIIELLFTHGFRSSTPPGKTLFELSFISAAAVRVLKRLHLVDFHSRTTLELLGDLLQRDLSLGGAGLAEILRTAPNEFVNDWRKGGGRLVQRMMQNGCDNVSLSGLLTNPHTRLNQTSLRGLNNLLYLAVQDCSFDSTEAPRADRVLAVAEAIQAKHGREELLRQSVSDIIYKVKFRGQTSLLFEVASYVKNPTSRRRIYQEVLLRMRIPQPFHEELGKVPLEVALREGDHLEMRAMHDLGLGGDMYRNADLLRAASQNTDIDNRLCAVEMVFAMCPLSPSAKIPAEHFTRALSVLRSRSTPMPLAYHARKTLIQMTKGKIRKDVNATLVKEGMIPREVGEYLELDPRRDPGGPSRDWVKAEAMVAKQTMAPAGFRWY